MATLAAITDWESSNNETKTMAIFWRANNFPVIAVSTYPRISAYLIANRLPVIGVTS